MLQKVVQLVDDPSIGKLNSMTLKHHINILHCLQFAKSAWESVTAETIQNCWRKAGFGLPNSEATYDPFDEVEVITDSILNNDLAELDKVDDAEPCRVAPSGDIHEIVGMLQEEFEGGDDEEESLQQLEPPTSAAILQAMDTIRRALYATNANSSVHSSLSKVENYFLSSSIASRLKQTRIDHMWQTK